MGRQPRKRPPKMFKLGRRIWCRVIEGGKPVELPTPYTSSEQLELAKRYAVAAQTLIDHGGTSANFKSDIDDVPDAQAFIYAVQLWPKVAPNRLKIGTTINLRRRFSAIRSTNPEARLLACWHGGEYEERLAFSITPGRVFESEVFDCPDIMMAVTKLDELLGDRICVEPSRSKNRAKYQRQEDSIGEQC